MKQNSSYKKLKCLFKGYAGKVYLVELSSENDQPNKPKERIVLKRYYKKPNDPQEVTSLNEYQMLQKLDHQNIIKLQSATTETYQYKKYLCLSFDHMAPLNEMIPFLKHSHLYAFKQICLGVEYLHDNSILHRDIKPSNIFGTLEGKIKIGDFGISTYKKQYMTASTCTKNYRAPELFFGQREYDGSIDIWALGCTLAEMYLKKILFDGRSEIEIMTQITEQLGSLDEQNWPGVSSLPTYLQFINEGKPKLMETIASLPVLTQQLVIGMLSLNPKQRPNIKQILQCLENIEECKEEIAQVSYHAMELQTKIVKKQF